MSQEVLKFPIIDPKNFLTLNSNLKWAFGKKILENWETSKYQYFGSISTSSQFSFSMGTKPQKARSSSRLGVHQANFSCQNKGAHFSFLGILDRTSHT